MSLIFGIFLYISDRSKINKKINIDFSNKSAVFIGLFQVLAFIPGASRAGVTITGARFLGYDRIFKWAYKSKIFSIEEFDEKYSYGSHKDNEVLDFAIENIPGKTVFDKITYFFQMIYV